MRGPLRARKPTLRGEAVEPVRQLAVMLASVSRPPVPIWFPARPQLTAILAISGFLALERSDFETLIGGSGLPLPSPIQLTGRGADVSLKDDLLKPKFLSRRGRLRFGGVCQLFSATRSAGPAH